MLGFSLSFITLTANRRDQDLIDIQTTAEAENRGCLTGRALLVSTGSVTSSPPLAIKWPPAGTEAGARNAHWPLFTSERHSV